MAKRYKMSGRQSRRDFRHKADRTHSFNLNSAPLRGGIRL